MHTTRTTINTRQRSCLVLIVVLVVCIVVQPLAYPYALLCHRHALVLVLYMAAELPCIILVLVRACGIVVHSASQSH